MLNYKEHITSGSTILAGTLPTPKGACTVGALAGSIAGIASTPDGKGYWLVTTDGRVINCGDAPALGSVDLPQHPVVAIVAAPHGEGYWVVDETGMVWAFGTATWHGQIPHTYNLSSNQVTGATPRIVAVAADQVTGGYWLLSSTGTVYNYDAPHYNCTGSASAVGIAATARGTGYWIVSGSGHITACGSAKGYGSTEQPARSITSDVATGGYWVTTVSGDALGFSAPDWASVAKAHQLVGLAALPNGSGLFLTSSTGTVTAVGAAIWEGSAS